MGQEALQSPLTCMATPQPSPALLTQPRCHGVTCHDIVSLLRGMAVGPGEGTHGRAQLVVSTCEDSHLGRSPWPCPGRGVPAWALRGLSTVQRAWGAGGGRAEQRGLRGPGLPPGGAVPLRPDPLLWLPGSRRQSPGSPLVCLFCCVTHDHSALNVPVSPSVTWGVGRILEPESFP